MEKMVVFMAWVLGVVVVLGIILLNLASWGIL